jgi:hypothetical protein
MQYYGMVSGSRVVETHGMSRLLQVIACVSLVCACAWVVGVRCLLATLYFSQVLKFD